MVTDISPSTGFLQGKRTVFLTASGLAVYRQALKKNDSLTGNRSQFLKRGSAKGT